MFSWQHFFEGFCKEFQFFTSDSSICSELEFSTWNSGFSQEFQGSWEPCIYKKWLTCCERRRSSNMTWAGSYLALPYHFFGPICCYDLNISSPETATHRSLGSKYSLSCAYIHCLCRLFSADACRRFLIASQIPTNQPYVVYSMHAKWHKVPSHYLIWPINFLFHGRHSWSLVMHVVLDSVTMDTWSYRELRTCEYPEQSKN